MPAERQCAGQIERSVKMNVTDLSGFFRALGHRVIETKTCFWYAARPLIFKSLPCHSLVSPAPGELSTLFFRGAGLAVRYPSPPGDEIADGGMYICTGPNYGIQHLSANVRSHTRRGLARCKIARIGFSELATRGYDLLADTTMRQTGRRPALKPSRWKQFCKVAADTPDIEAWGAFVNDQLATFIVGMQIDDCYYIHVQKSASSLLKYYPNNALLFTILEAKLAGGAASTVSHGQIALAAREGLYRFKRGMGFEIMPFKEKIAFNPVIRNGLPFARALARHLKQRYPANLFWTRVLRSIDLGFYPEFNN